MARILVTNFLPFEGGGHLPYVHSLTQIAESTPHLIGVAAPAQSSIYQSLKDSDYPFLFACDFPAKIQKELPGIINSIRRFREIVSEFKPEIVHTNGAADLSIAAWSYFPSSPYLIIRTHHNIRTIHDHFYHRWLYKKKSSYNIYVSQSALSLSTSQGFIPSRPLVISNGIDLEKFRPIPRNQPLAAQLGISDQCFCFGSCAGTAHYKRVDTLIHAALKLKKSWKGPFKIVVLGDESAGKDLQLLAQQHDLTEFIYGGFHNDIQPYVSLFDVGFILSDSIETISYAAREMMAMGKPLLSSSFSGLKENVLDGVNGFLVDPGDIDAIALAMQRFLEMDRTTLAQFSLNARTHALNHFAIREQINAHAALYERILREFPKTVL